MIRRKQAAGEHHEQFREEKCSHVKGSAMHYHSCADHQKQGLGKLQEAKEAEAQGSLGGGVCLRVPFQRRCRLVEQGWYCEF